LAALGESVLQLAAEEEIMLAGWYHREAITHVKLYTGAL